MRGAIASSIGHDSHNVCVIGCNDADMAVAVNRLIETQGRLRRGGLRRQGDGELALPIAGLMSDRPFEEVEQGLRKLRAAVSAMGTTLHEPFLQMAFLRPAGDPASAHHRQGAGRRRSVRVGGITARSGVGWSGRQRSLRQLRTEVVHGQDKAATLPKGWHLASRMFLQSFADYVRENVPDQQRRAIILKIGTAMAELIDISRMIYDEHPGLNPHQEEERLAARMRGASSSDDPAD